MNRPIIAQDSSIPLSQASLSFTSGALSDPDGKEGLTRLLLSLMRRGAGALRAEALDEELDRLGATVGADISRSTSGIGGGVIARNQERYFKLLRDVIVAPHLDSSEFVRLKEETQASWVESLNDDSTLARRFFARALFEGHAYGRLAGGTPESLARIELADVQAHYSRLISADTLRAAFSGDLTQYQCEKFFDELRLELKNTGQEEDSTCDPVGPIGRHLTFVDKPERSQTQILMGGLGTHPTDEDHTALYVGHIIFGGTFSGRLSQEVRGKRGWSYGAYSSLPFDRKRQAFSLWTFPQNSDAADCIELELELLRQLIDEGVTEDELSAAKLYLSNSHAFSIDTASKRASQALDQVLYALPKDYFEAHLRRVEALTVQDVNAALRNRLSANNLVITVVGTQKDLLSDIEKKIPELKSTRVVPFDTQS